MSENEDHLTLTNKVPKTEFNVATRKREFLWEVRSCTEKLHNFGIKVNKVSR